MQTIESLNYRKLALGEAIKKYLYVSDQARRINPSLVTYEEVKSINQMIRELMIDVAVIKSMNNEIIALALPFMYIDMFIYVAPRTDANDAIKSELFEIKKYNCLTFSPHVSSHQLTNIIRGNGANSKKYLLQIVKFKLDVELMLAQCGFDVLSSGGTMFYVKGFTKANFEMANQLIGKKGMRFNVCWNA